MIWNEAACQLASLTAGWLHQAQRRSTCKLAGWLAVSFHSLVRLRLLVARSKASPVGCSVRKALQTKRIWLGRCQRKCSLYKCACHSMSHANQLSFALALAPRLEFRSESSTLQLPSMLLAGNARCTRNDVSQLTSLGLVGVGSGSSRASETSAAHRDSDWLRLRQGK